MKEYRKENNITIMINALREIIEIFIGPFLTTYFIKTSREGIVDISTYNIYCYAILLISAILVGSFIRNRWNMRSFRLGVVLNFDIIL